MRITSTLLWIILLLLSACVTDPVNYSDLSLDDLKDMTEYTESMLIAADTYKGKRVEKVAVNGIVHNDPEILLLAKAGYYRIEISHKNSNQSSPEVIRLVILDPARGETEWGLPPWTPQEPEYGTLEDQEVRLIHTSSVPANSIIPMVVIIDEELTRSDSYLEAELGSTSFRIKRGVGSVQMAVSSNIPELRIDGRTMTVNINKTDTAPETMSGVLAEDTHIPAGSYVNIPADLTIPAGFTLRIDSGSFITIDPEINIINNGLVFFAGSALDPITVTCSEADKYWGGFIGTSEGNRVEGHHTIFCKSGHHTGGEYDYGHAGRQALFFAENGELKLDHCYMTDHIGQVFFPRGCTLELSNCLVQRAKTGGQINESELAMDRCIFTDFPDDSYDYQDDDNDGLYLNVTNALITNSTFMFAKDDGLDSGASGGGEVIVHNCRFEANFHEGAALSSGHSVNKLHLISSSVFTNCGQGLELGYSSPNHLVEADSCLFLANGIGIRYGDCYESAHRGYIHISNSQSLDNSFYDVWNMNREHWNADTSHMSFDNVVVSRSVPMYPELISYE